MQSQSNNNLLLQHDGAQTLDTASYLNNRDHQTVTITTTSGNEETEAHTNPYQKEN